MHTETQWLNLDRTLATTAFALLHQAAYSVHRGTPAEIGSNEAWTELKAYYAGERMEVVGRVVAEILGLAATSLPNRSAIRTVMIDRAAEAAGIRSKVSALLRKKGAGCYVRSDELAFVGSCLQDFVWLLGHAKYPSFEVADQLRKDMVFAEQILEIRCRNDKAFQLARSIEHFRQTQHRKHYTLQEVIATTSPA